MASRIFPVLLLACLPLGAWANCPPHSFTEPAQVRLPETAALLVTHASSTYDARYATKRGIDEAIRFARNSRIPRVYLQDDSPNQHYFMDDCAPDYWVHSVDGEVPFAVTPSHIYIVGGHLEQCLSRTLHDVLYSWSRQPRRNLTVTLLMDGIYSNGKSIEEGDRFYQDFMKFLNVVTFGRPGGEHWPKVSLLEIAGVIGKEKEQMHFLKRVLPHYERTMPPDYRVELKLNDGRVKVIQQAPGWRSPTLRFNFVDSALAFSEPLPRMN